MMHVYGPVPSRRLGQSLGIDLLPAKTCNYSCVYCQLGKTNNFTNERKEFFDRYQIWEEITSRIEQVGLDNFDVITFVGQGEPTLSKNLGWYISKLKKKYTKKIAVITNGALLYDKSVKKELSKSDIILPTLDVPNEKLFRIVNRPHPDLSYQKILDGMESFFSEFQGEIWLEVMLIKDLNDKTSILQDLANIIIKLNPDRIYVNVPIRPPTESWVKIPSKKTIQRFKNLLKDVIDISIPEKGVFTLISNKLEEIKEELIETIKRHPMRKDQIQNLLIDKGISEPIKILNDLEQMELIQPIKINDVVFFEWKNYQFK